MTQRERLVTAILALGKMLSEIPGILKLPTDKQFEIMAECLMKIGVILPPCKVGDTVWIVFNLKSTDKEEWFMTQDVVQGLMYGLNGFFVETRKMRTYPESKIGDTIFFTREEAEAELEKRRKEEKRE